MDAIVGALTRTGRLKNTVLIFVSDNGYSLGAHRWKQKLCPYEECIKEPLLVRAPGLAPRRETALASNVDLAPTIADFAGVQPPGPTNGRSLKPLLANPAVAWRGELLLEQLSNVSGEDRKFYAVRTRRYLYGEYLNGDRELYDLNADPFELTNQVTDPAYGGVVTDLQARLAALKTR